jgi:hypothetical protein
MAGVTTRHSDEPYANSARTVLWEVLGVSRAPTRCVTGMAKKIGGERRKARFLTRSPNEGNPTPMGQGRQLGAPSRTEIRKEIGDPRGGVWKKP